MDLIESTETSFIRKVDGADCTFTFLTAYDRADLLRAELDIRRAAHKARRPEFIENLKMAEFAGEALLTELEAYAQREPAEVTEADWIAIVNSPLHEVGIFEASLRHTHGDAATELAKKSRLTLMDKARICGLEVTRAAPEKEGEGRDDPNPAMPAVYGTPAVNSTSTQPVAA